MVEGKRLHFIVYMWKKNFVNVPLNYGHTSTHCIEICKSGSISYKFTSNQQIEINFIVHTAYLSSIWMTISI